MDTDLEFICGEPLPQKNHTETVRLYPGAELLYLSLAETSLSVRQPADHILQINYCKAGKAVQTVGNERRICLNPGNFLLQTMYTGADMTFQAYQGLLFCIDLLEMTEQPPEPLRDTDILKTLLRKKSCLDTVPAFLAGNEQTESIFSGFYDQPAALRLPYQRIKTLELLLYLTGLDLSAQNQLAEYQAEQLEIVREIHDQLLQHIERRVTIEELSRQYLINPTTLKAAFKAVYGTSLAAHIKEHRIKQAAAMLLETDMSIAEIAQAVGYDSQSRFTAAFKAFFHVLPREYRKQGFTDGV